MMVATRPIAPHRFAFSFNFVGFSFAASLLALFQHYCSFECQNTFDIFCQHVNDNPNECTKQNRWNTGFVDIGSLTMQSLIHDVSLFVIVFSRDFAVTLNDPPGMDFGVFFATFFPSGLSCGRWGALVGLNELWKTVVNYLSWWFWWPSPQYRKNRWTFEEGFSCATPCPLLDCWNLTRRHRPFSDF